MKHLQRYTNLVAMILVIVGVVIYAVLMEKAGLYVFLTGAILLAVERLAKMSQTKSDKEVTRLPQIHLLSALALVGAGYLMYQGSNSWSVLLLITAFLELYVSFRQKK